MISPLSFPCTLRHFYNRVSHLFLHLCIYLPQYFHSVIFVELISVLHLISAFKLDI